MKKILTLFICTALLFSLLGCANQKKPDKKIIAVSIVPQTTFVEKICGDNFEIITMIPPGASAETFEPTIAEIADLNDASLYFAIGVPAEKNIILPSINDKDKIIELHTLVEKVYPPLLIDGERDPHLWLSPKRVITMVKEITSALCELDPDNAEEYTKNSESYCKELNELDGEIKALFNGKQSRKFMVFHPAFGYIAQDYSLTMLALEEHGKEADAKHLSEMADIAKAENITTIFYQAETSNRQAEAFAEEIDGSAVELSPLSPDYVNNMKRMAEAIAEAMK